jgi:predicted DNA-binding antitoxin AbrB/MazE fold protein
MVQVTVATFENGVLVPDQPLGLPPRTRVRIVVDPLDEITDKMRDQAWADLTRLWQTSTFDSKGDRLTREQLHERR